MARLKVSDEVKDKVKDHVDDNSQYPTMRAFTEDALRKSLEQKNTDSVPSSEKEIREIVRDELREALTSGIRLLPPWRQKDFQYLKK